MVSHLASRCLPDFAGARGAIVAATDLLACLDNVRETHSGWTARCPGPLHERGDQHCSLAVARGRDDDRWLIHCYAGCTPIEIMRAIGLELQDLYDDRQYRARGDRERPRLSARDALIALDGEITVAMIIAADMLAHREIDEEDYGRLSTAAARIGRARALIAPARVRP